MVLVCHPHRFIFMKTRKTAGTSVEMYLERFAIPGDRYTGSEEVRETVTDTGILGSRLGGRRKGDTWYNHMPAKRVRSQLGAPTWDSYLKITTVRNPYARLLSQFLYRRGGRYPGDEREFARLRDEFVRFVKGGWFRRREWTNDLEIAGIDGRVEMDVLIRNETLHEDVEALCARLGLPWEPARLPHTKKAAGDKGRFPLALYYTPETRRIVAREFDWLLSRVPYRLPEPGAADAPEDAMPSPGPAAPGAVGRR